MNIKEELVSLCKETIDILYSLKEKDLISEEELQSHLKEKNKFIERFGQSIDNN